MVTIEGLLNNYELNLSSESGLKLNVVIDSQAYSSYFSGVIPANYSKFVETVQGMYLQTVCLKFIPGEYFCMSSSLNKIELGKLNE